MDYLKLMGLKKEDQNLDASAISKEAEALAAISIKERLSMSYEERIEAHENARVLMQDLKSQGELLRAKSQRTS
ncbi:MAG: hypothetical protein V4596_03610 [Bdellovibrionota bacterium]